MNRSMIMALSIVVSLSCGGSGGGELGSDIPTNVHPTVSRIDPGTGKKGDTVTIFGLGFSVAVESNVVSLGETSTHATSYKLLDPATSAEIESLTFVIPDEAQVGNQSVTVTVGELTSNDVIQLAVTP